MVSFINMIGRRKKMTHIEPKIVFKHFDEICKIKRPSYDEGAISEYLVQFAVNHDLEYHHDEANNVIIYKGATQGRETDEKIILQSHIDMVCVADGKSVDEAFENGVEAYVDGDHIRAKGTTLGADDGIGIAMTLAILASEDISHPGIEAVFTTSEEVGLDGAKALDESRLSAKKMINIDTEEEDNLVIGCAGGCRSDISFTYKPVKEKGLELKLVMSGLTGGHSGVEIHKGSANANVLMGRLLYLISKSIPYGLKSIHGGEKENAICDSCEAIIIIKKKYLDDVLNIVSEYREEVKISYFVTDPYLDVMAIPGEKVKEKCVETSDRDRIINIIVAAPHGVMKMRQSDPRFVEKSLNLGVLSVDDGKVSISHCLRSNSDANKKWLQERLSIIANAFGAEIDFNGDYPAWESVDVSDFAKSVAGKYEKLFGKPINIHTEHAGLECALFSKKIPGIDAISIGPNITGAHTVSEALSISSVQREWELIKEILKD